MAKKTYTFATDPKIRKKAGQRAKKEKITFSEAVDKLLREYVGINNSELAQLKTKAAKWDDLGDEIGKFYPSQDFDNIEIPPERQGDLVDIGEAAAMAFGYL